MAPCMNPSCTSKIRFPPELRAEALLLMWKKASTLSLHHLPALTAMDMKRESPDRLTGGLNSCIILGKVLLRYMARSFML